MLLCTAAWQSISTISIIIDITNLHQPLQLVEFAVQILKVVFVESSEAVLVHDFHQHREGLFLRHLKPCG